jgi:integrase
MPRKARDERLDTRTARLKLPIRPEPYWRTIQEGRAIGYRRLPEGKAGTWIARHYVATEGRRYQSLGSADDLLEADGGETLSFAQAQTKAAAWFQVIERAAGRVVEPITVAQAMEAYVTDYIARGGKGERKLRNTINSHILPEHGDRRVADLTLTDIRRWHQRVSAAPARLRTKADSERQNVRIAEDTQALRARRATANRVLTVLRAALSLAYRDNRVPSDDAWRRIKPFPNVDAPRIRYITDDEAVRLVNACPEDFRALVVSALLTGCRYGELMHLRAVDWDAAVGVLHVREAKAGKPRAVPLGEEAHQHFAALATGRPGTASMLVRADGERWGESHQHRPLRAACEVACISPAISFHVLRHTFASRLAMRGVPMAVIAAALGNTEAICARHYAHLSPGFVADTIRRAVGTLGIVPATNVMPLRREGRT